MRAAPSGLTMRLLAGKRQSIRRPGGRPEAATPMPRGHITGLLAMPN